jgi:hypothetical protein
MNAEKAIANILPTKPATLVGVHLSNRMGTPENSFVKIICIVGLELLLANLNMLGEPVLAGTATSMRNFHVIQIQSKETFYGISS